MTRIHLAVFACVVTVCISFVALARQDGARLAITGRVSPVLKLSFSEARFNFDPSLSVTVEQSGLSSAIITLQGNHMSPSRIVIPFEIRTNIAYEVKLEPLSLEDCSPELLARVGSVRASGKSCAAEALEDSAPASPFNLTKAGGAVVILKGPRVSRAGGIASPTNALVVALNIDLGKSESVCQWQAAFRISLE